MKDEQFKKIVDATLDYVLEQSGKINTELLLNNAMLETATNIESKAILNRIIEIRAKLDVLSDIKDIIAKGI